MDNIKEGQSYYFGFPKHAITSDTIGYFQCMSPFYDEQKIRNLDKCSSKIRIEYIDVYPNPVTNSRFSISGHIDRISSLTIFNTTGQFIHTQDIGALDNNSFSIPENVNNGIYVVIFQTGEGLRYYSKVMVGHGKLK